MNQASTPLRLLTIVAGTNDPSNCALLANAMMEGIRSREPSATIDVIHLKDIEIAHFNLSCYGTNCPIDGMTKVQALLTAADGVIIATPMWNFSVPAHLKNLIDRMGSFALDQSHSIGTLNGKPFYLIITAGMPTTALRFLKRTMKHINLAISYFGGSILGTHIEGRCTKGRGEFGLVVDTRPASLSVCRENGQRFAVDVRRFKETRVLPLKYRIMRRLVRWMQLLKRKLGL